MLFVVTLAALSEIQRAGFRWPNLDRVNCDINSTAQALPHQVYACFRMNDQTLHISRIHYLGMFISLWISVDLMSLSLMMLRER